MKLARTTTSQKAGYAPGGDLKFAANKPLEISICFLGLALSNGKKYAMERLISPYEIVTQVDHSVYLLSTFMRIRTDPSMQIF